MSHTYFKRPDPMRPHIAGMQPWRAVDLMRAYGWPTGLAGGGTIAIVELGGAFTMADVEAFCTKNGIPVPTVGPMSPFPSGDADGEVALDIQVAAAGYSLATGKAANIRMFWGNDIATLVREAADAGCDVCSISWGQDEAIWGQDALTAMEAAAAYALSKGMVVFAASGDNDSSDGGSSPANVDAPAACPSVLGCGGTMRPQTGIERVWNANPGKTDGEGTGGGYSTHFPQQVWQIGAPPGPGRMVPDIAANADPATGWLIVQGGVEQPIGGTSAVAPMYAGLVAAFGTKLGDIRAKLWSNPGAFNDITTGDNGEYHAQVGPDPCTGLGSPRAALLSEVLGAAGVSQGPQPPPSPSPPPAPAGPLPPAASALQRMLNDAGVSPPLVVDGIFGPASIRALETYYRTHRG